MLFVSGMILNVRVPSYQKVTGINRELIKATRKYVSWMGLSCLLRVSETAPHTYDGDVI